MERPESLRKEYTRWTFFGFTAVAVLGVVMLVAHLPPVQGLVWNQLRSQVESRYGIALAASSFRYNLLRFSFEIDDLAVRLQSQSGTPVLTADAVGVNVGLWRSLLDTATIQDAVIEGARVDLLLDGDGNSDRVVPEEPGPFDPLEFSLPVHVVSLRAEGEGLLVDSERNLRLEVPAWRLEIRSTDARHRVDARIDGGRIETDYVAVDLIETTATLEVASNQVLVESFQVASALGSLSLNGAISNIPDPVLDLQADLEIDLGPALTGANLSTVAAGIIQNQVEIRNGWDDLEVTGQTQGTELIAGGFQGLALSSRWGWVRPENRIGIDTFSLSSETGQIGMTAELNLEETEPSRVALEFADMDLGEITGTLGSPVRILSEASGSFSGSWEGYDWRDASGSGRLDLEGTATAVSESALPVSGMLLLEASSGGVRLATEALSGADLTLQGNLDYGSGDSLAGDIRVTTSETSRVLSSVAALRGSPSDTPEMDYPAGPAQVEAALGGSVTVPSVRFSVTAPALSYRGFGDASVRSEGLYRSGLIELESALIDWEGQRLAGEGLFDLRATPPAVDLKVRGTGVSPGPILQALGTPFPLDGRFDFESDIGGSLTEPRVDAGIDGSGVSAYGVSVGVLTARLGLDGEGLELADLVATQTLPDSAGGVVTGDVRYRYDGREFTLRLDGSEFDITRLSLPTADGPGGIASFVLNGDGSLDEPRGRVDLTVADATYGPLELGDLLLRGDVEINRILLDAELPRHDILAESEVRLEADFPATLAVEIERLNLADFGTMLPEGLRPVDGFVQGSIRAAGEIGQWRDGSLQLELAESLVSLNETVISTEGETILTYDDRRFRLEPSVLVARDQRLEVSGDLPVESSGDDGLVRVEGVLDLGSVLPVLTTSTDVRVEGVALLDLELRGHLGEIRPTLDARLRGGSLDLPGTPAVLTGIDADATVADNVLSADSVRANWNGASIDASAWVPLVLLSERFGPRPAVADPARLDARIADLELASIPGMPSGVTGSGGASLSLLATELSLEGLEARLAFDTLRGSFNALEFEQERPVTLSLNDGQVRVDPFSLVGPRTLLRGSGTFGLDPSDAIELDLFGQTDALELGADSGVMETSGSLNIDLRLTGTLAEPVPSGEVRLEDMELSVVDPAVEIRSFDARLLLAPETLTVEGASGTLNGGTIDARGTVGYRDWELTAFALDLAADDIFLEIPEGLRTLSRAELRIDSSDDDLIGVDGSLQVLEGAYTGDIELSTLLLDYVGSAADPALLSDPNPTLSRIRYDVAIDTVEPLVLDNNIAHAEANANLQLVGSYYRPGLIGRITMEQGGEIEVRDTRFVIETGTVDFVSPNRIEPSLNVVARTEYRGYDVAVQVTGGGEDLETSLTSDPPLSEPNIVSLLLTGRTLSEVRGAELNVAREQALFYVTGALGTRLTRTAEQTLGLSRVRIEPNLIANESDPGARLTVGENLMRNLELIYSMNLADSKDQIWIAEYGIRPQLLTRGVKQEDNTYRLEVRHDLAFGVEPTGRRAAARTASIRSLRELQFAPDSFEGRDLASVFDLESGARYNFFDVRQATERLENHFAEQGYLESRVRVSRAVIDDAIDLDVSVDPGPLVQFDFTGMDLPRGTVEEVGRAWRENRFDELRGRTALRQIRAALVSDGYLEARAEYSVSLLPERKIVSFLVNPGSRYDRVEVNFEGVRAFETDLLREELSDAGVWDLIHVEPERVQDFLERRYRTAGYRDATVSGFRYDFRPDEDRASLTIGVNEGPEYRISGVRLTGNQYFRDEVLRQDLDLVGRPLSLDLLDRAERDLEERYWRNGYSEVLIERSLIPGGAPAEMEVDFSISERAQSLVREIEIVGNRKTSENFARSQLAFETGQPLNFEQLNDTRRNLYNTGAYSVVEIQTSTLDTLPGTTSDGQQPVRVRLNVEEVPTYTLRYGGFYDTERGPGVIADLTRQNLWGASRVVGLSGRYDGDLYEVRGYFSEPAGSGLPFKTNVSAFLLEEVEGVQTTDRRGVSLQQEIGFLDRFRLSYGYRYEKTHTVRFDPDPSATASNLNERFTIAPLTAALARDTRDDLLDASNGSFVSNSLEYATAGLGSDASSIRYFGQVFRYFSLSEPSEVPFSGGLVRSRFVYATGVRLGLIAGLNGDSVVASEKFFSGGGTSVRGFTQDRLGPTDALGDPLGGDAVFTLNNEIRFPIFNIVEGVGFLDAGNVYSRVADLDLFDLRASVGFGLRLRTPYFLLRADYGLKLDRRVDEKIGTFFFSIGQAF